MAGESSDSRASQTLKHAVGMVAAAGAYKGLQLTWKQVTGKEPPMGPDDQQAPLGRAIAWTLLMTWIRTQKQRAPGPPLDPYATTHIVQLADARICR